MWSVLFVFLGLALVSTVIASVLQRMKRYYEDELENRLTTLRKKGVCVQLGHHHRSHECAGIRVMRHVQHPKPMEKQQSIWSKPRPLSTISKASHVDGETAPTDD
jgi:hypothetical protein